MMQRLRVISTYLRVGALNELQYRVNFWINLLQSLLALLTAISGLAVVYDHTDDLAGWGPAELLVLVGIYFLMGALIRTWIQPSMQAFLEAVRVGTLDFMLMKPEDSQLLVSIQRFQVWSALDFLLGIGIIVVAFRRIGAIPTSTQVMSFAVMLVAGGVIVYCFYLVLTTFAFWFVRVENILVIFDSMYQAGRWPVNIYPPFLRVLLTFFVPVAFAVTVPAEALIGRLTPTTSLLAVAIAAGIFLASRWFWRLGVRHYSGASA